MTNSVRIFLWLSFAMPCLALASDLNRVIDVPELSRPTVESLSEWMGKIPIDANWECVLRRMDREHVLWEGIVVPGSKMTFNDVIAKFGGGFGAFAIRNEYGTSILVSHDALITNPLDRPLGVVIDEKKTALDWISWMRTYIPNQSLGYVYGGELENKMIPVRLPKTAKLRDLLNVLMDQLGRRSRIFIYDTPGPLFGPAAAEDARGSGAAVVWLCF
jgi:hypothetical protein